MRRAAIVTIAVCAVLVLASIIMGIVGIWTGDDRWGDTAMLIGFPAAMIGAIIAVPFLAILDEL